MGVGGVPIVDKLPRRLGIILPSLTQGGRPLSAASRGEIRKKVQEWFAAAFTGSTEDRLQVRPRLRGRWGAGSGVSVEEVEEIWVFCSATGVPPAQGRPRSSRRVGLEEG